MAVKKKGGTKRPAPASLPALAEELVAQPREKANNLPRLLAALKPGCTEVRDGGLRRCLASPPLLPAAAAAASRLLLFTAAAPPTTCL